MAAPSRSRRTSNRCHRRMGRSKTSPRRVTSTEDFGWRFSPNIAPNQQQPAVDFPSATEGSGAGAALASGVVINCQARRTTEDPSTSLSLQSGCWARFLHSTLLTNHQFQLTVILGITRWNKSQPLVVSTYNNDNSNMDWSINSSKGLGHTNVPLNHKQVTRRI